MAFPEAGSKSFEKNDDGSLKSGKINLTDTSVFNHQQKSFKLIFFHKMIFQWK